MEIKDMSVCFHTSKALQCKDFYVKYFNATVTFYCGWYVVLSFGDKKQFALSFMAPQENGAPFDEKGITLNIKVDDVDVEYKRLIETKGLISTRHLVDNPWGDRSFAVLDPLGNTLYIYSDIEVSAEFVSAVK